MPTSSGNILVNHRFGIRMVLNAAFVVFAATGAVLLSIQDYPGGFTWMVAAILSKTLDLYYQWRFLQ